MTQIKATFAIIVEKIQWVWSGLDIRLQAFIAGILCALAHPPFGFMPGLLGYGLLFLLADTALPNPSWSRVKNHLSAFSVGFFAGLSYFLISCFWVFEAFMVEAETYGWMAPFAVVFLASVPALFFGITTLCYRAITWPNTHWRHLAFAGLFVIFEMIRGFIFTGFPWNPAGASFKAGGAISQFAAVFGVYGLSLLALVVFSSLGLWRKSQNLAQRLPIYVSATLLSLVFIGGFIRVANYRPIATPLKIRVVQPNIEQAMKWSRGAFQSIFDDYVAMTIDRPKDKTRPPDLIIWPEGALPASADDLFAADSWTAPILSNMLEPGQFLIMGAYHSDYDVKKGQIWRNAMLIIEQKRENMEVVATYSKFKLVPFGEFTPLEGLLSSLGVKSLVHLGDSFTAGERTKSIAVANLPRFLPLICYEGIFPSLDQTTYRGISDNRRPQFIINISNDAWFGPTSGPIQHLNLASFRAIEEGLPLVRSTPTGISGSINPIGQLIPNSSLGLKGRGYIDFYLPKAVKITPYTIWRNYGVWLFAIFCLIFAYFGSLVAAKITSVTKLQPVKSRKW